MALLDVKNLKINFNVHMGTVTVVDGVGFSLEPGRTLGIVGESGSGKSVSCLSLTKLIPMPPGVIAGGEVYFEGTDLLSLTEKQLRKVRGKKISMIFQEPMTAFNPLYTIGEQISEVIRQHQQRNKREAFDYAVEMLKSVSIPVPEVRVHSYPHQLSGGMKQRAMIAMAMCCHPQVLIADEPSTALDVTVQAQVLQLIDEFKKKYGTAVILVTHNIGVVTAAADDVLVMYVGNVFEKGDVYDVFNNPRHPYTRGLIECANKAGGNGGLKTMSGFIPNPANMPEGCAFNPRCPQRRSICNVEKPPLISLEGHDVACWLYG